MSGIRSYEMSGDNIKSLILALEGDEEKRVEWLGQLRSYDGYRDRQIEILGLIEKWFKAFALRTGVHLYLRDWQNDEDNLMDWVYYQMEYVSGIMWDESVKKVVINKYASSRPLLNEENTQDLLDFINEKLRSVVQV